MQPAVLLEVGQVAGDGGLRHAKGLHEIADAEFGLALQEQEQAESGFIGQRFENIDSCFHGFFLIDIGEEVNCNEIPHCITLIYLFVRIYS